MRLASNEELLERLTVVEAENTSLNEQVEKMKSVCNDLIASAEYWGEYDVPLGIVARLKEAVR